MALFLFLVTVDNNNNNSNKNNNSNGKSIGDAAAAALTLTRLTPPQRRSCGRVSRRARHHRVGLVGRVQTKPRLPAGKWTGHVSIEEEEEGQQRKCE